jgi:rod shape determining protein RodA
MSFNKRIITHFNFEIIILLLPLMYFSNLLLQEINSFLAFKQLLYYGLSIILFFLIFFFPIRRLIGIVPIIYWVGIISLISVEFFGTSRLGATRWLDIGFGLSFQPSEIFKPIYILMLGYLVAKYPPPPNGYGVKKILMFSFYILLPFLLVVSQPDLGTALVILFIGYGALFIAGINWKIIVFTLLALAISSPVIYETQIKEYQKKRITDFLSKEPSYHVKQSMIAIGSGGMKGNMPEEATQTRLNFLPIATSDFIFAYFVERYGFTGSVLLLLLYFAIILSLFTIAKTYASNDYLILIFASSLAILFFLNMSINTLMTLGLAPVVGLPLPLFSYGGSSFINFIVTFAILENLITFRFSDSYAKHK